MSTYIISFKFEAGDDETATKMAESSAIVINKLQSESFFNTISEVGVAFTRLEEQLDIE